MPDLKLTKTQNEHFYYMADAMRRLEWDLHSTVFHAQRIPRDWHQIATQRETEKTRITLRVDRDVVKWFRSMGPGYQPRMNDVLRAFMHAKLAGLLCPSSDNLGQLSVLSFGGSGSYLIEVMRFHFGGASAA